MPPWSNNCVKRIRGPHHYDLWQAKQSVKLDDVEHIGFTAA